MTIHAYTGLPGSGKTLQSVGHDIVKALRERRLVVTNVPLNLDRLAEYVGHPISELVHQLDEDTLGHVPFSDVADFTKYDTWRSDGDKGNGPLYVVDECHECFAECTGLKAENHPIVAWMATHRHKGADVVLMTQDRTGIPPAIRRRCEFIYEYRSMRALGLASRYARLTYLKRGGHAVDRTYGKYQREWFGLYHSHGAGVAEKLSKPKNILLNWRMMLVLIGIPLALFVTFANGMPSMPGSADRENDEKRKNISDSAAATRSTRSIADSAHEAMSNVAGLGGLPAEISTPATDALREQIALVKLSAELQALQSAQVIKGGELAPNAEGFIRYRATPEPQVHTFDGARVRISGHFVFNGQHIYWVRVVNAGRVSVHRGDVFESEGFKLSAIDDCRALLKGPHGAYKLSCHDDVEIGHSDVSESETRTTPLEFTADATGELKPVPASEGRQAP